MKYKIIKDLKALFFITYSSFKNQIIEIIQYPLKTMEKSFEILILLGIFIFAAEADSKILENINNYSSYIGGGLLLVLTISTLKKLRIASNNYLPTYFSPADVNILFSSPIGKRTLYFYSILKGLFGIVFALLFILIPLLMIAKGLGVPILWSNTGYFFIGLFFYIFFMQTASFFIYSFNKRFHKENIIRLIIYFLTIGIFIIFFKNYLSSEYNIHFFFETINNSIYEWIPIIGWTKGIYMGLFRPTPNLPYYMSLNALMALVSATLAVFWATDYYEEAQEQISIMKNTKILISKSDYDTYINEEEIKPINITFKGKGPKAFLWKEILLYKKRLQRNKLPLLWNLLFLVGGSILAYFIRNKPSYSILIIIGIVGYNMASILSESASWGLNYEMKHIFIYTLPGRIRDKIFYINLLPLTITFTKIILFVLPLLFLTNYSILDILSIYLAYCSMVVVKYFDKILFEIISPNRKNNILLNILFSLLDFILYLPSLLLSSLAYYFTKNIAITCILFTIGGTISVPIILYISEKFFNRIEFI